MEPLNMPLEEAMRTQRAIRKLRPDAVSDETVLHLIELALKAPVGSNAQNWVFLVVKNRGVMSRIARLNKQAWRLYSFFARRHVKGNATLERTVAAGQYLSDHFHQTPVLVVACLKGRAPLLPHVAAASFFASIYPAVQNFLLAARAAGLGSTLITLPLWNVRRLKRILNLPGNVTPCALLPLGWPMGKYGPTTRRPVGEVVHVDSYGHQPFLQR